MKKILTNMEVSNIIGYINTPNSIAKDPEKKLSISLAWSLRKNINTISELNMMFEDAKQAIMDSYMDDKYSYNRETENGTERIVRDEYIPEYNQKLVELYNQKNEVKIDMVDIDKFAATDIELSLAEMDILSFMINDNDDDDSGTVDENNDDIIIEDK